MRQPIDTIRISKQGRDQLTKLRRQTGIEHWNALCRWALCVSFREASAPPAVADKFDGGVEMSWKVFSGSESDVFSALCWVRAERDGFPLSGEGVSQCIRAHIHRGLAYLASGSGVKSISGLVSRSLQVGHQG